MRYVGDIFVITLDSIQFIAFSKLMELPEELSNFVAIFTTIKVEKNLEVSPEAPFIWKLLYIGIFRVQGHNKNLLNVEVCDPTYNKYNK